MYGYDASKSIGGNTLLDLSFIGDLDADDLDRIAAAYEQTARLIRLKSAEKRQRLAQQNQVQKDRQEWRKTMADLAHIMIVRMEDGLSAEAAIAMLEKETGRDKKTLAYILKSHLREKNNAARDKRRIMTIRLAQDGWSNKRIANWLGCHANTVCRDLRQALDPER